MFSSQNLETLTYRRTIRYGYKTFMDKFPTLLFSLKESLVWIHMQAELCHLNKTVAMLKRIQHERHTKI